MRPRVLVINGWRWQIWPVQIHRFIVSAIGLSLMAMLVDAAILQLWLVPLSQLAATVGLGGVISYRLILVLVRSSYQLARRWVISGVLFAGSAVLLVVMQQIGLGVLLFIVNLLLLACIYRYQAPRFLLAFVFLAYTCLRLAHITWWLTIVWMLALAWTSFPWIIGFRLQLQGYIFVKRPSRLMNVLIMARLLLLIALANVLPAPTTGPLQAPAQVVLGALLSHVDSIVPPALVKVFL